MRDVWTIDEVKALEVEDWWRYEIVDGALMVSPSTDGEHELACAEVRAALWAALPADLVVVGPIGVELERSYRVPDLVVVERARLKGARVLRPGDLRLVVEVVSAGSQTADRIAKPAQYAAAGIPSYWRVETDPIGLTAYTLDGAGYVEVGTWSSAALARIAEPVPVEIDLARLAV